MGDEKGREASNTFEKNKKKQFCHETENLERGSNHSYDELAQFLLGFRGPTDKAWKRRAQWREAIRSRKTAGAWNGDGRPKG